MPKEQMEFVEGMIVKPPHERAPDFVKANISIKVEELAQWLAKRSGEQWVNIDVKESKGGKWYAAVSNFKPKGKSEEAPAPAKKGGGSEIAGKLLEDDIPF